MATQPLLPPEQRTLRAALDQRGLAEPLLSSYWSDGHYDARGDGPLRRAAGAVCAAGRELWTFSRNDPRKPVYAAKVATALALITLLVFLREPSDIVSHSVWAILTVVVVFEFSIGATLSKGLNRGLGTLTAGGLALAVAESARHMGDQDIVFLIITTFAVGFATTLIKVHPKMKLYEYGLRVFLLTFCYVTVSGYNTGEFVGGTALSRFLLIVIGAAVSLAVNIGIYPIWAGEDLHHLVARNFARVAESLEGCVDGYLTCMEYQRVPSKILTYQASDDPLYSGYRAAVEAQTQEEALLGFAIWEPPHGPYKMMKYPWQSYTKVGGALRHCSFAVMALHGCILSEIQSAPENRQVFSAELHRVGDEAAKVLRELGHRVKTMTRLSSPNILSEVLHAAEELQKKIDQRSYLLVNTDRWGEREDTAASTTTCSRHEAGAGASRENEAPPPPPEQAVVINIPPMHKSESNTTVARAAGVNVPPLHKSESNTTLARAASVSIPPLHKSESSTTLARTASVSVPPLHKSESNTTLARAAGSNTTLARTTSVSIPPLHKSESTTTVARAAALGNVHKSESSTSLARFDSAASWAAMSLADGLALKPQGSWHHRVPPFHPGQPVDAAEARTYESASALSLGTFASLLIEFVARLGNLVNAVEELSDKAAFKDPVEEPSVLTREETGVFGRMTKFFRLKR
ncbi:aluminum-activated malate transporter 6-like [Triticum dicoccoides]|uniref:aluminum-activated malate transporter 6-like n=1 Tax=Triticum dicoccoides TaxID=85692 RepID=UPI001891BAA3|nr:aluminum-activated malate transporter 6-like [Triticum dicoccoides]